MEEKKKLCTEERISSHMSYAEAKNPILSVHLMQSYTTEMRSHQALKREILHKYQEDGYAFHQSHMDCHDVRFVERLRTIWAFSHTIGNTIFNAIVAKSMAARFDSGVLEMVSANGAKSKRLLIISKSKESRR